MIKNLPSITMVLGGAASGKSLFAENMIKSSGLDKSYIATSQIWDQEMRDKIEAHKIQRGSDWQTIEEPLDLETALQKCAQNSAVLIDCATLWLTNQMFAEANIRKATSALMSTLKAHPAPIIIVTNEVGSGIVPEAKMGRQFRNIQGAFNQSLAAQADLVVQVIAGLPQILKGDMP